MRLSKVVLVLFVAMLASPLLAKEEIDLKAPLPVDPNIARMEKLENGMAYPTLMNRWKPIATPIGGNDRARVNVDESLRLGKTVHTCGAVPWISVTCG